MLEDIKKLIETKKYEEAEIVLNDLMKNIDENSELYSNVVYLFGYLNTKYDYQNKNEHIAKDSFFKCINSNFALPEAYINYIDLEEDQNVAINYLKQGIKKFPKNGKLYLYLLKKTALIEDKLKIIDEINNNEVKDYYLFVEIIKIFINRNEWQKCYFYAKNIIYSFELDNNEKVLFELIISFSLIFLKDKNFIDIAETLLKTLIDEDIDNSLNYASYVALVWVYTIKKDLRNIKYYLNKIPFNGLKDYCYNPWLMNIDFKYIYVTVLDKISLLINDDKVVKQRIDILRSMYICNKANLIGDFNKGLRKYSNILEKAFKKNNDINIGITLIETKINLKQYFDAYNLLIKLYEKNKNLLYKINIEDLFDNISDEELIKISQNIVHIIPELYVVEDFIIYIVDPIIGRLFKSKIQNKFQEICSIANLLADINLKQSSCKFEIAYSYDEIDNSNRAENIYQMELRENPQSSAVLNNLGVIYKSKKDFYRAFYYFSLGLQSNPDDGTCKSNYEETKKLIIEQRDIFYKKMASNLNTKFFDSIGYNIEFKKLFEKISNKELKELLLKDLEECAICIATNQNKAAIILCGSIIEAVLMDCIINKNIKKYKIKGITKDVKNMGIADLLSVAEKEKMITRTTYNLSSVIKDYRNIIHPSNLLRKNFKISNERAFVIWNTERSN